MAKSDRLFRLMTAFRALPQPVTAQTLAAETGVSIRTLYRDIASLRVGGAVIDGEAGLGYTLTEDSALPPQMFTRIEVEALVLGLTYSGLLVDPTLSKAATAALGKIIATLPERVQRPALHAISQAVRLEPGMVVPDHVALIRTASWDEAELSMRYTDLSGRTTERRFWPLAIIYFDKALMCLAHCCLRHDVRRFHLDRMDRVLLTGASFRPRRVPLLREYTAQVRAITPQNQPPARSE